MEPPTSPSTSGGYDTPLCGDWVLFATGEAAERGAIECRERLGGLLKFYYREAA